MLTIKKLEAGYGNKQVLFGLSMEVRDGEIVALIGPNGAGKSTVLKTICGLLSELKGEIQFNHLSINGVTPAHNVVHGITFAPQGNRVFHDMTVIENLEIGGYVLPREFLRERISGVLEFFPMLKDKLKQKAGSLSGGEQQMVSLARAFVPMPKLLMLDEPSLGLAPNLAKNIFNKIIQINKEAGVTILVVEQKVREVLKISDRVYALKLGKVSFEGKSSNLINNKSLLKNLFL